MTAQLFKSSKLLKDSAVVALAIIGVVASMLGIAGTSLVEFSSSWQSRLGTVLILYCLLVFIALVVKYTATKQGLTISINGTEVSIKEGDLFLANGLKVIPFNEYFDTTVDDVIISHASLNGIFIDEHVEDIEQLQKTIHEDDDDKTGAKRFNKNGRDVFPLGRVIVYNDYLLLSFTLFNEHNMAHLSKIQYEKCLMLMWREISRTYAGKPVFLPLLGSGITRFDDVPSKSNFDLLKCILCTLKSSGTSFNSPITILLTKDVIKNINLYDIKGAI